MHRSIKYTFIVVLAFSVPGIVLLLIAGRPRISRHTPVNDEDLCYHSDTRNLSHHGEGSVHHAWLWMQQLLACNSPSDIRKKYNCGTVIISDGSHRYKRDLDAFEPGKRSALLYEFGNGDWVAIVYENSHWKSYASGTVVLRDSNSNVRVFFGHVCGRPHASGMSINEIHSCLDYDSEDWKEIPIEKIIEHGAPSDAAARRR